MPRAREAAHVAKCYALALEIDFAGRRRVHAGNDLDQGRLARPVVAEQAHGPPPVPSRKPRRRAGRGRRRTTSTMP